MLVRIQTTFSLLCFRTFVRIQIFRIFRISLRLSSWSNVLKFVFDFLWDRGPDWPKNFLRGSFDFEFAFEFKSLFGPKRFDYWLFFFLFAYHLLSIFWDVIELNPLPILKLFLYQNSTTTIPLRLLVSSFRTRDSRKKTQHNDFNRTLTIVQDH